jgi:hypothetical protein
MDRIALGANIRSKDAPVPPVRSRAMEICTNEVAFRGETVVVVTRLEPVADSVQDPAPVQARPPHPVLADTSARGHREPRDRAPRAKTRVVIAYVRQYRQAASAGASTTRSAETTILAMQLVHHRRPTQSHAGDSTSAMYLPGSGNPSGITWLDLCL